MGRRAADRFLDGDRPDVASEIARALVETHRGDEASWEQLARAQLRAGDRGGALRSIREAGEALAAELEIEPGPGLGALEAEIRSHRT